jgi:hypothetical protein
MAEQYVIRFSSDKIISEGGKDLAAFVKEKVDESFDLAQKNNIAITRDEIEKKIKVQSKRDNEKSMLQAMLQTAFKAATKPQDSKLIADIDAAIEEASDSVLIAVSEFKTYIQDQYEATIKRLSTPVQLQTGGTADIFPYYWKHCREMLVQIYAPELNKETPKATEPLKTTEAPK